jgi:pyroglutamyl-peptidase
MKILISGFMPFDNQEVNPSWQAVKLLPNLIEDKEIIKIELPVEFNTAAKLLLEKAKEVQPDVIVATGLAAGRKEITPELVGINWQHGRIADNAGYQPEQTRIAQDGADAYFASLPVYDMAEAIREAGFPAAVSYSAGSYVCNDVLYSLLYAYQNSNTRCGFVHVPLANEYNKNEALFSMPLENISKGLEKALSIL